MKNSLSNRTEKGDEGRQQDKSKSIFIAIDAWNNFLIVSIMRQNFHCFRTERTKKEVFMTLRPFLCLCRSYIHPPFAEINTLRTLAVKSKWITVDEVKIFIQSLENNKQYFYDTPQIILSCFERTKNESFAEEKKISIQNLCEVKYLAICRKN